MLVFHILYLTSYSFSHTLESVWNNLLFRTHWSLVSFTCISHTTWYIYAVYDWNVIILCSLAIFSLYISCFWFLFHWSCFYDKICCISFGFFFILNLYLIFMVAELTNPQLLMWFFVFFNMTVVVKDAPASFTCHWVTSCNFSFWL